MHGQPHIRLTEVLFAGEIPSLLSVAYSFCVCISVLCVFADQISLNCADPTLNVPFTPTLALLLRTLAVHSKINHLTASILPASATVFKVLTIRCI